MKLLLRKQLLMVVIFIALSFVTIAVIMNSNRRFNVKLTTSGAYKHNMFPTRGQDHVDANIIDCEKKMPDLDFLWDRFVIVTAISENHVKEAYGMLHTVQKHMPGKRVIVYDLGIKASTLPKIKNICGVELRKFEPEKYPPHTKDLHTYAWKVFIINETLNEFGAIFWGDASARFLGSLRMVLPYLHLHYGFMTHIHSYDPKKSGDHTKHQFYYTNKKMFSELGVNREEYLASTNAAPHLAANRLLFINNSVFNKKVLQPLTECALRKQCIAPVGAAVGNHRFDASALALLLYKNMRYEWTPENHNTSSVILDKVVTTERVQSVETNVKMC